MFRQPERDKLSRDCVVNPSLLRPIRLRAASSFSGRTYNTTEHSTHQAQYLKLAKLARRLGSGDMPRMLVACSSVMLELPGHPRARGAAAPRTRAGIATAAVIVRRDQDLGLKSVGLDWDRRLQKLAWIEEGIDKARWRPIDHTQNASEDGRDARRSDGLVSPGQLRSRSDWDQGRQFGGLLAGSFMDGRNAAKRSLLCFWL